jgi:hypothetical protein
MVELMHLVIQGIILVVNGRCQAVLTKMRALQVFKSHMVIGLGIRDILEANGLATEKIVVVKFLVSGTDKVGTEKTRKVIGPAVFVRFMTFSQLIRINEVGSAPTSNLTVIIVVQKGDVMMEMDGIRADDRGFLMKRRGQPTRSHFGSRKLLFCSSS